MTRIYSSLTYGFDFDNNDFVDKNKDCQIFYLITLSFFLVPLRYYKILHPREKNTDKANLPMMRRAGVNAYRQGSSYQIPTLTE